MNASSVLNSAAAPFTVAQLNRISRDCLESSLSGVWVRGELTALSRPDSGHWYFTLKDELGQLSCALFKFRAPSALIKVGTEVLVYGTVTLYEMRGQYQMVAESIVAWGVGQRHMQFEALKNKLYEEGLLDVRHKKPLPRFPSCIGIISSRHAAGFQDLLVILKRRYPLARIRFYPSLVQGEEAPASLIRAIDRAELDQDCLDVLMLVRGGGSSEDLWCFNDEALARRLFACVIPVITGVGHEVDTTLVDWVADVRAPTPSAAAEMVVPDIKDCVEQWQQWAQRIDRHMRHAYQAYALRLDGLRGALLSPDDYLARKRHRLDQSRHRISRRMLRELMMQRSRLQRYAAVFQRRSPYHSMWALIYGQRERFMQASRDRMRSLRLRIEKIEHLLMLRNPAQLLEEGWAWVESSQGQVRSMRDVAQGTTLRLWMAEGCVDVVVIGTHPHEEVTMQ